MAFIIYLKSSIYQAVKILQKFNVFWKNSGNKENKCDNKCNKIINNGGGNVIWSIGITKSKIGTSDVIKYI